METAKRFSVLQIVLAVLALAGIAAWIFQLVKGLGVTGMSNAVSWGSYIILFMYFVGLSAGGLIVASASSVFGIKQYKAVAKPAILLSTVCIVVAALFILIDLGGVARVFNLLLSPNFSSPLVWDMLVILCYLIVNIVYLILMRREDSNAVRIKRVSFVALPVAVLVHSVTAWIFGLQIAKIGWHSALLAPMFVVSALVSGIALLLIVLVLLQKFNFFDTDQSVISSLAKLLVTCVVIDAFLVFCELLTLGYPGGEGSAYLIELMTGKYAVFFWLDVVVGLALPAVLLLSEKRRKKISIVITASALAMLGVLSMRIWLLLTSFSEFVVSGGPGVTSGRATQEGMAIWMSMGTFAPTLIELCIIVGVISLAALSYILMAKKLFATSGTTGKVEDTDKGSPEAS